MARAQLPLGSPLCCCSPSLPHALVPRLASQHLNLWASSPLCLHTHLLLPSLWASGPFWPSFTSGTHLFVPQSPALLGPHVSGFLCLRVPSAQGLRAARSVLSPRSPSLGLPPLQGRLAPAPSQVAPFLSISRHLSWWPIHCGEGQRTTEGPPCPRELMQIRLLPGGGVGAPVFCDGWRATPAWPRGPTGPAAVAAERGWLWSACT